MAVTFYNADVKFTLKQKNLLKQFIVHKVKRLVKKEITLSYIFCSDDYLLDINRRFLNHDYYTDIITFPLSEDRNQIEAEIYISVDRVKDNALNLGTAHGNEMLRVLFHGVLHLIGYKDKTKAQQLEMRTKEEEWIKAYKKYKG